MEFLISLMSLEVFSSIRFWTDSTVVILFLVLVTLCDRSAIWPSTFSNLCSNLETSICLYLCSLMLVISRSSAVMRLEMFPWVSALPLGYSTCVRADAVVLAECWDSVSPMVTLRPDLEACCFVLARWLCSSRVPSFPGALAVPLDLVCWAFPGARSGRAFAGVSVFRANTVEWGSTSVMSLITLLPPGIPADLILALLAPRRSSRSDRRNSSTVSRGVGYSLILPGSWVVLCRMTVIPTPPRGNRSAAFTMALISSAVAVIPSITKCWFGSLLGLCASRSALRLKKTAVRKWLSVMNHVPPRGLLQNACARLSTSLDTRTLKYGVVRLSREWTAYLRKKILCFGIPTFFIMSRMSLA